MSLDSSHRYHREPEEWLGTPPLQVSRHEIHPLADAGLRLGVGALGGAALACLFLLVGLLRLVLALLAGANVQLGDLSFLGYYVGAFTLAGAILGLLAPLGRRPVGRYALALLGAGVVFAVFGFHESGQPSDWDESTWFATVLCTLIFGAAAGYASREFASPRKA